MFYPDRQKRISPWLVCFKKIKVLLLISTILVIPFTLFGIVKAWSIAFLSFGIVGLVVSLAIFLTHFIEERDSYFNVPLSSTYAVFQKENKYGETAAVVYTKYRNNWYACGIVSKLGSSAIENSEIIAELASKYEEIYKKEKDREKLVDGHLLMYKGEVE